MGLGLAGRSGLAWIAVVAAAAASIASLDEAAPFETYGAKTPEQSVVLADDGSKVVVKLRATSSENQPITLTIRLKASWDGFAGGAGDHPIVRATVAAAGATDAPGAETLDRAITTAPGKGELIVSAEASCAPATEACGGDFTFTLDRIEPVHSGPVVVKWTAEASISSDTGDPQVLVEVVK